MGEHSRRISVTIKDTVRASVHAATEAGQDLVTASSDAIQDVLHYDQAPPWMRNDPYIKHGYRPQSNSFYDCFWSLFYSHNELINIWSHLLPACCHLALLLVLDVWISHSDVKVSRADSAVFQLYILCTVGCDLLSALYHGINSHSEHISRHFLKCDYLGIVLSIFGTIVSATWFGSYNNILFTRCYIAVFAVCSMAVFRILLRDDIDGPGAAPQRVKFIVALAATGLIPPLYMVCTRQDLKGFAITHGAAMISLYILAAFFYLSHLPERWWPHTFDIWGASHQIFHLLIAVGQVFFLFGLKKVMLKHYLDMHGPIAHQLSKETGLSVWIDPRVALQSGFQPSFETSLSVWIDPRVALLSGFQPSIETSLSALVESGVALLSGFQPSIETSLSVLVESGVALWEGRQV